MHAVRMKHGWFCLLCIAFAMSSIGLVQDLALPPQPSDLRNQIMAEWAHRDAQSQTLAVDFIEQKQENIVIRDWSDNSETPATPQRFSSTILHRLLIDGENYKYSFRSITKPHDHAYERGIVAFDGDDERELLVPVKGRSIAQIKPRQLLSKLNRIQVLPIVLVYQPLINKDYDLTPSTVVEESTQFADLECAVLNVSSKSGSTLRIWTAKQLKHLPVRYTLQSRDVMVEDLRFKYDEKPPHSLKSFSWDIFDSTTGDLRIHSDNSIANIELNIKSSSTDFKIELPEGIKASGNGNRPW